MRKRRLGAQGPEITTVGFGAWALGGPWKFGWGPQDDDDSVRAIRRAIDSGINWIDTAAVYGLGHSEEVTGRALEPYRVGDEVFTFTKCGRVPVTPGSEDIVNDLTPASIRHECEQSLKRLNVERIDLYQFHWPDGNTGTPLEDSWATMADLVQEGKVRWAGVSNFNVDQLEQCEPIRHVDSLQPPLSLLNRSSRNGLIPWCAQHGTGVIVYSPMASGLLTGKFDRDRMESLPSDDWRKSSPNFREPRLSANLELVDRLGTLAEHLGTTLPAVVVAWTLAIPGVTAAIVGARRPGQVDGWLPASDLDLSDEDLAEIEAAVKDTGAGSE
ncbi:MAG: aldo/keto reductase [Actinomycetota bacterium]|nr:aldo/keto reductase [Actinomycetota bacterium]